MAVLRVALAQVDSTVGDIEENARQVRHWAAQAARAGAALVAFPEMMLTGYPVEDLVFRDSFVAASRSALEQLAVDLAADGLGELTVLVGYLDADGPARRGTQVTLAGMLAAEDDPATASPVGATPSGKTQNATGAGGPRDALAVLHGGRVAARYFKHHLPNYGVFDEDRYFVPGDTLQVIHIGGVDVALTVCEDIWQAGGPFTAARRANVDLVVSVNASPYERNKDDVRLALVARRAREAGAAVAYVNLVGGQDELVFDGDSMFVDADGELIARGPQFRQALLVQDVTIGGAGGRRTPEWSDNTDGPGPAESPHDRRRPLPEATPDGMRIERTHLSDTLTTAHSGEAGRAEVGRDGAGRAGAGQAGAGQAEVGIEARLSDHAEVWQALVLGLRDYVRKNGFRSVVLGLSGGIDSSVVAAIACDAIGPDRVTGVSMPSGYSSEHSRADAADLARRTGLDYRVQPIQPMVDAFITQVRPGGAALSGLAEENLQARVRGVLLMALSNQEGHLVLTTGNKSELAVGYSTLYGDSVGGFNPIKDVPKTLVWELARWRNADAVDRGEVPPIPENAIVKPPSAELRPGQLDTDSLPDYPVLDALLAGYVDGDLGRDELIAAGHDAALVDRILRLVDLAEYKRRQSAPGTKISIKAFGRDRRLPITNRYREGAARPISS